MGATKRSGEGRKKNPDPFFAPPLSKHSRLGSLPWAGKNRGGVSAAWGKICNNDTLARTHLHTLTLSHSHTLTHKRDKTATPRIVAASSRAASDRPVQTLHTHIRLCHSAPPPPPLRIQAGHSQSVSPAHRSVLGAGLCNGAKATEKMRLPQRERERERERKPAVLFPVVSLQNDRSIPGRGMSQPKKQEPALRTSPPCAHQSHTQYRRDI